MLSRRKTLAAAGLLLGGTAHADEPSIAGTWTGVLETGVRPLRLRIEIGEDGAATLESLDQAAGVTTPGRATRGPDGGIEIVFERINGRYRATLAGPDRMKGVWRQTTDIPTDFVRGEGGLTVAPPAPMTATLLADLRRQAGSPAFGAAVERRGNAARYWVDGQRSVAGGPAVAVDDLWHLGSITKSMTATLVGRLVEAGRVSWDDTAGAVLGSSAPDMRPAYAGASFRHLLSHRAGLAPNIPLPEMTKFSRRIDDARAERLAYAKIALAQEPTGRLGERYEYANSGYVVAGAMLEARLGQPWERLIQEHLFGPMGVKRAGFGAPGSGLDQPLGHAQAPGEPGRQAFPPEGFSDNVAALGPAGRVHMPLQDLIAYLRHHRDGSGLLKPETWRTLHTPPFGGVYALGWSVGRDGLLSHSGSNTLWYAEVAIDPAAGLCAAAVCNDGDIAESAPRIARALRGALAAG